MKQVMGFVGKADVKYVGASGDKAVCNFTVAESNGYFDKTSNQWVDKGSTWYEFAVWNDPGFRLGQWIQKGMKVLVDFDKIEVREYQKTAGGVGFALTGTNVQKVTRLHHEGNGNAADEIS